MVENSQRVDGHPYEDVENVSDLEFDDLQRRYERSKRPPMRGRAQKTRTALLVPALDARKELTLSGSQPQSHCDIKVVYMRAGSLEVGWAFYE